MCKFLAHRPKRGGAHGCEGGMRVNALVRWARETDVPRLTEIYNAEVRGSAATFDTRERTVLERMDWFRAHGTPRYPLLVAEVDGVVAGYACLSPYRPHDAYASTAELSVYVDAAFRGHGLGARLLEALLDEARRCGELHVIVSVIAGGNAASVHLHERFGFRYAGTLPQVGYKLGAFHDIVHYYLLV